MNEEAGKKKILVIDDEEPTVTTLTVGLEKEGYEVFGAYTGEKGLQLAQTERPDAIILDIFLPGEDGLSLLKKLKRPLDRETGESSKTRGIPVIILTGYGKKMKEIFEMEKAFSFFTKPFELKAVLASVEKALESK